jgi:hypothetical protein
MTPPDSRTVLACKPSMAGAGLGLAADVAEAWVEVARLRRLARLATSEALERRGLVAACAGDPLHPRSQGLSAAAEFHAGRAAAAAERARDSERRAAELELRHQLACREARCA